jgi:gluconate kinase
MPPSLLDSQFATLEPPGADEPGIIRVSIEPPVPAVIAAALDGIEAAQR